MCKGSLTDALERFKSIEEMRSLSTFIAVVLIQSASCFGSVNLIAPQSVANTHLAIIRSSGSSPYIITDRLLEGDGTFYDVKVVAHEMTAPPLKTGIYSYTPNADNTAILNFTYADGTNETDTLNFTFVQATSIQGTIGLGFFVSFKLDSLSASWFLVNGSSRGLVGPSTPVSFGFVITGSIPRYVLIRAVGPGMAPFNVNDYAPSPSLEVLFQGTQSVAQNSGWSTANGGLWTMNQAFARTGAFALPANSGDCAVVVLLQPGEYIAQASSSQLGEVLVEVYLEPYRLWVLTPPHRQHHAA